MRILSMVLAMMMSFSAMASSRSEARAKAMKAGNVLSSFLVKADEAIPTALLKQASCVMVITDMVKFGFVVGARTGWGLASCRTAGGWSPAAFYRLNGINYGFLVGLQKLNVVLVFTRPDAVDALSSAKLSLGADISVAAGPVGRDLGAGVDYKFDSPVYTYARGKGLYAGASLGGSVLDPREGYNNAVYGGNMSPRDILTNTNQATVSTVEPFLKVLRQYAPEM